MNFLSVKLVYLDGYPVLTKQILAGYPVKSLCGAILPDTVNTVLVSVLYIFSDGSKPDKINSS